MWWHKRNRHTKAQSDKSIDECLEIVRRATCRLCTYCIVSKPVILERHSLATRNSQLIDYISHRIIIYMRHRRQLWMARNNVLHNSFDRYLHIVLAIGSGNDGDTGIVHCALYKVVCNSFFLVHASRSNFFFFCCLFRHIRSLIRPKVSCLHLHPLNITAKIFKNRKLLRHNSLSFFPFLFLYSVAKVAESHLSAWSACRHIGVAFV